MWLGAKAQIPKLLHGDCDQPDRHDEWRNRTYTAERSEIELLRAQIGGVDSKIENFLEMAAEMQEPRAVLRKVEALEKDRRRIEKEIEKAEAELREVQAVTSLNDRQIRALLENMAEDLVALDRERLKDNLRGMVRRIVLDPARLTCRIYYDIPVNRGG